MKEIRFRMSGAYQRAIEDMAREAGMSVAQLAKSLVKAVLDDDRAAHEKRAS